MENAKKRKTITLFLITTTLVALLGIGTYLIISHGKKDVPVGNYYETDLNNSTSTATTTATNNNATSTPEDDENATDSTPDDNENTDDSENPPAQQPYTTQPPQPVPPSGNWWDYPAQTIHVTKSGDDLLVLVNKTYFLPPEYIPGDLVALDYSNTGGMRVYGGMSARNILIADLMALGQSASSAGIDLAIVSSYRSFYTQESTYNYWVSQVGQTQADMVSARPGHSQHQLGTALDFTTNLGGGDLLWQAFDGTPAANWLAENAWQYGFVQSYPAGWESTTGYSAESWHYRYIGVANAQEWRNSGQILEVWLRGW